MSGSLNTPVFWTHDWIAFKAYELAGRPAFIENNRNRYFIGTEALDNGMKPSDADGAYDDTSPCHCLLFNDDGMVTQPRNELRTRQEFDKAVAALNAGQPRLAAFYAGALAHYVGDLSQFCHIMGKESHWGGDQGAAQRLRARVREHHQVSDAHINSLRALHHVNRGGR